LLIAALIVSGCADIGIAVKRGQRSVDPGLLPLVCIRITTDEAALPLESMTLENLDTHEELLAMLSNLLNNDYPEMLTAAEGDHRSLSMPILHLRPGRYQIKSLYFEGPSTLNFDSSFIFEVAQQNRYSFTVKPDCVNYVGSLVIFVDWSAIRAPLITRSSPEGMTRFLTRCAVEDTAARDAQWATDVIPGMKGLSSVASHIDIE
jgi:hypothetical protein